MPINGFMKAIILLSFILLFTGCVTTGFYSKTGPSLVSVQTESGVIAYNKGDIEKTGQACSQNVLGIVSFGDSGIGKAKSYGGLEKVFFFDTEFLNVLGIFGQVCTKVYGQ